METFPEVRDAFRNAHPDTVLVAEHMWNAQMSEGLRRGTVDVVLASCPESHPELSSRPIRRERIVASVSKDHPAADAAEVALCELASSESLCPPADLAPRFNHVFIGMCQAAGFDPIISRQPLVSGWETGIVLDRDSAELVAECFAVVIPDGVVALPLMPLSYLETVVMWRTEDPPDAVLAFADAAASVFARTLEQVSVSSR